MLDRIRAICNESAELLAYVLDHNFEVDLAIRWLEASLADLDASSEPADEQIDEVFTALAGLQNKLIASMAKTAPQHHPIIENLTDRIDIFLFHHRLS